MIEGAWQHSRRLRERDRVPLAASDATAALIAGNATFAHLLGQDLNALAQQMAHRRFIAQRLYGPDGP